MSLRPRVIFDCNVLVQGILNPDGASAGCLRLVETGRVCALVSTETLAEAGEVLSRPFMRVLAPQLTAERVSLFLAKL